MINVIINALGLTDAWFVFGGRTHHSFWVDGYTIRFEWTDARAVRPYKVKFNM